MSKKTVVAIAVMTLASGMLAAPSSAFAALRYDLRGYGAAGNYAFARMICPEFGTSLKIVNARHEYAAVHARMSARNADPNGGVAGVFSLYTGLQPAGLRPAGLRPAGATSPWAASLGIGTTGVTASLFYRESPNFVATADVGGFAVDPSFSAGGENYHMGIRLLSARLAENWYPFHGNLFIAAGVLLNDDRFRFRPEAAQGNYAFATPASFRFSPVAPYLGIGWGYPFTGSRWTFRASAGAAYEGSPKVSVTMGTNPYALPAYQAEKSSISTALSGYRWYPVAQVSLVYRFG